VNADQKVIKMLTGQLPWPWSWPWPWPQL